MSETSLILTRPLDDEGNPMSENTGKLTKKTWTTEDIQQEISSGRIQITFCPPVYLAPVNGASPMKRKILHHISKKTWPGRYGWKYVKK